MSKVNANEIISGLWIGDANSALNESFIKKNNITVIVNCTPDIPSKFKENGVEYLRLNLDDSLKKKDFDKMIAYLPHAVHYIHDKHKKKGKKVLVHCHAGMQRSTAVVIGYLCNFYNMELAKAAALILSKRPVAFHNGKHINFIDSLLHYKTN
jgi:protein-tyrosine phosphatase